MEAARFRLPPSRFVLARGYALEGETPSSRLGNTPSRSGLKNLGFCEGSKEGVR